MSNFFDPLTLGFLVEGIHPIPEHARPVTPESKAALLSGIDEDHQIGADENGDPILIARPAPSAESLAAFRRADIIDRLQQIDQSSGRPAREISLALAAGDPLPDFAVAKLTALESEAADLRAELACLH